MTRTELANKRKLAERKVRIQARLNEKKSTSRTKTTKSKIQEKRALQARITRIKEKLETGKVTDLREARIAKIKEALDKKKGKTSTSARITALKERQARRTGKSAILKLREEELATAPAVVPGAAEVPAEGMGVVDLPEEVVAEIAALKATIGELASLAGVEDPMATDGIAPAEGTAEGAALTAPLLAERIKRQRAKTKRTPADKIVEGTQTRISERKTAIAALRKRINESYASEGSEKITAQVTDEVKASMGLNHNDKKVVISNGKRTKDNPGMVGSAKLKAAATWPTKPTKGRKFESDEIDPEAEGEVLEESWDQKHITKYVEKKQLSFNSMIKQGLLG